MKIKDAIQTIMDREELTQAQIAQRLSARPEQVCRWKSGVNFPHWQYLNALQRWLGEPIEPNDYESDA